MINSSKPLGGQSIYDSYLYEVGVDFENWVEVNKERLLASIANLVEDKVFYGKFDIETLNNKEIYEEIERHRRIDCQHTFKGEFISYEELTKIIKENCKKLVFRGYVILEDVDFR